jgi:mRNA-degrading endonuclease toxin of MazEF toxin-antitoxin module
MLITSNLHNFSLKIDSYNTKHYSSNKSAFSSFFKKGDLYQLKASTTFEKGEVVQSKKGTRPSVIISCDQALRRDENEYVTMAYMTGSVGKLYSHEVVIPANTETGLRKKSKIMTNQLFTVKKSQLQHAIKIGSIGSKLINELDKATQVGLSPLIKHPYTQLVFSRGMLVEMEVEQNEVVKTTQGIIVSNDLLNQASKVVTLYQKQAADLNVKLNTVSQDSLRPIKKISREHLQIIHTEIRELLGIDIISY